MTFQDTDKILVNRDGVSYQADIGPLLGDDTTKVSKIDTLDQNVRSRLTIGSDPLSRSIILNTSGSIVTKADSTINGVTVGMGGGSAPGNTALGTDALLDNTTGGYNNTAVGYHALYKNTDGKYNTAVAIDALKNNTTGGKNTAVGQSALYKNTEGQYNTAVGSESLFNNSTGEDNVAVGNATLYSNTTGGENTALGISALFNVTTGSGNIGIGGRNSAGVYAPVSSITTQNDRIVMGSNTVTNAYVQVAWTVVSDARDKTNFAPVPHGLDFVKQLQPTQYEFRVDRDSEEVNGPIHYGFKAQDILALEGDHAVIIDTEDPDHLKYKGEHLVPVLVNAIQEQQVVIDALVARLEAVEAKIV